MFFSSSKLVLLILTLVQLAIEQCWTFSFVHRKWDFLLPRDLMEKIFALEADAELDKMEVERLTDQLLKEVPRSVLEQLELPRFYSRLPFNIRWQIKELLFDKSLVWSQKHEAIFALIQTLPSQMRRFAPIQHVAQSSVDDLSFARPTLAGTGHSRLFESLSALKYTVSFTFQTKELCEILPQPLEAQLYTALSSNKLNIEQKLAAVENVMSELPFGVLDRLFFVGVPIVDAEVRERFRRLWYDRPYWSSDAGEEEGIGLKMQNSNNVDSPMLLNLPVPSSSAQQDPIGRASIFYQHQLPSSQPIIPPLKPPKIPLTMPNAVTIDEHYNVAAPPLETWRRGLCPQCNGMPDAMTSLSNMVSPTAMPKAQLPAAVGVDHHDQHQKQTTELVEQQQQPSMEKKPAVRHGGISIRVPTFIPESNGSAPPTADGDNVILPDVPDIGEANANLSLNQSAEKANGIKVPADSVEQRTRSKIGKRQLISAEQQQLDLDTDDDGRRMIVRHKKRRSDNFHGRLQMRHVNRLLGILQKQKFVR